MPEGTLRFQLPEEQFEFETAVDAAKWYHVAVDVDEYLRQQIKYKSLSSDVFKALQDVRTMLHETVTEEGLQLP